MSRPMEIALLAASVEMPSISEVNAESTSLVLGHRPKIASQPVAVSDTSDDHFVVSGEADDNGSLHLPAMQQNNHGTDRGSSRWENFLAAHVFGSGWIAMNIRKAVNQYQLHTSTATSTYGHALDVYA